MKGGRDSVPEIGTGVGRGCVVAEVAKSNNRLACRNVGNGREGKGQRVR